MNNINVTGRLVADVTLRYTQKNDAVANATIAVNRDFKNANGEREADFFDVVFWKGKAEAVANYTQKGSRIGVTGRLETNNYQTKEGENRKKYEIIAEKLEFLESKPQQQAPANNGGGYGQQQAPTSNGGGYSQQPPQAAPDIYARQTPPANNGGGYAGGYRAPEVNPDDIPF